MVVVVSHFSHVCFCATLWNVACRASLSLGSSKQEYWSGLPFPPPGDLPDPGIKPTSLMSPVLACGFFTTSATWEALTNQWRSEVKSLSRVWLLATPWTVAYQAPPSMGFSWQEYWSELPFSPPVDLPDPGI